VCSWLGRYFAESGKSNRVLLSKRVVYGTLRKVANYPDFQPDFNFWNWMLEIQKDIQKYAISMSDYQEGREMFE